MTHLGNTPTLLTQIQSQIMLCNEDAIHNRAKVCWRGCSAKCYDQVNVVQVKR